MDTLLFHDSAVLIPLLFSCIDGVKAEAKGAARMNNLWTSIVLLFNIVPSYCSLPIYNDGRMICLLQCKFLLYDMLFQSNM